TPPAATSPHDAPVAAPESPESYPDRQGCLATPVSDMSRDTTTLLEAWASHKSFKPKDGPPADPPAGRNIEVQWHGERRSNETHASTTDPEARLYRKSNAAPAKLCYSGHLLMEHHNALIVDAELTTADGYAERATAIEMLGRLPTTARRRTVAADKGYDTRGFIADTRALGFTPHVAPNTTRHRSAIDGRTTRHVGHAIS